MMRSTKENNSHNNKFIRFITYPIRVLGKAKEFYVRSLLDYANSGVGYGGGMGGLGGSIASLPKSFSVNSSRSEESDMDYAELLRVASLTSSRSGRGGLGLSEMRQRQSSSSTSTGLRKSCSVAMGRIDEDRPCDNFVEVGANYNKEFLCPRSRSYAVPKRNVVF